MASALQPTSRFLSANDSDVLSEAQAWRVVATLPRSELVAVPGIGHAPTLVDPIAPAVLDRFLGAR